MEVHFIQTEYTDAQKLFSLLLESFAISNLYLNTNSEINPFLLIYLIDNLNLDTITKLHVHSYNEFGEIDLKVIPKFLNLTKLKLNFWDHSGYTWRDVDNLKLVEFEKLEEFHFDQRYFSNELPE